MAETDGQTHTFLGEEISELRHRTMQHIRSRDTSIEIALRRALWARGYRYRKNYRALPGTPDIALTKYRIAVFCDSEFFHGKDWEDLKIRIERGRRAEYWVGKIEGNIRRDIEKDQRLVYEGWTVIHFWGQEILRDPDACVRVIEEAILDARLAADAGEDQII